MKKALKTYKQRGFFDLGISLIILALGATTVAIVDPDGTETRIAQEQISMTTETIATETLVNENLADHEIDD